MSQRQDGFNGGIHSGTSATTGKSRDFEELIKHVARTANFNEDKLSWYSGFSKNEVARRFQCSDSLVACRPDGGIWVDGDTDNLILSLEAKYQGAGGNAIESSM